MPDDPPPKRSSLAGGWNFLSTNATLVKKKRGPKPKPKPESVIEPKLKKKPGPKPKKNMMA